MDTFIAYAKRTAIGNLGGSLKDLSSVDLGATVVTELLKELNIGKADIGEVIVGNVLQAGVGQNIARQIALNSGLDYNTTASTINKVCGSGLYALRLADYSIKCNDNDAVIAGGVESMSNAPFIIKNMRFGQKLGNTGVVDTLLNDGLWDVFNNYHMGITAENVAKNFKISRNEQDEFAYNSQQKAIKAKNKNVFEEEIVPIQLKDRKGNVTVFKEDEYVKEDTDLEKLGKLKPAFDKYGTVTAGNASGINDGGAMLLLCNKSFLDKNNIKPIAKIIAHGSAGVDPSVMGLGPITAIQKVVKKAGLKIEDIGLFEINEAFASQSIAVLKELGVDTNVVNVNGGAIALGHPIGASGARIVVTLLHEMMRRNVKYGVASLCIGGGMGEGAVFELCQ